jgi:hypothetical protein
MPTGLDDAAWRTARLRCMSTAGERRKRRCDPRRAAAPRSPRQAAAGWGAALLAALALGLAACGGSSSKSGSGTTHSTSPSKQTTGTTAPASTTPSAPAGVVSASAHGITASMRPHSPHPVAERAWPISFTVTRAGRPARASVSYEYLFGGQVVARRSHYSFDGHFADVFRWPASAVGYPLTFRAVIVAEGATLNLDYPVQVVR